MRYWIGALCFAAALSDPRSMASMGEIGRSFVVFFVGYAALKTGLLWFAFDAHRHLSLIDLGGFYAALAAYVYSLDVQTRWRLSDALAAATEAARGSAIPAASAGDAAAAREPARPDSRMAA